jgi:hypothetical protein
MAPASPSSRDVRMAQVIGAGGGASFSVASDGTLPSSGPVTPQPSSPSLSSTKGVVGVGGGRNLKRDERRGVDNISGWEGDADHQDVVLETDLGAEDGTSLVVYMSGSVSEEGGDKDGLAEEQTLTGRFERGGEGGEGGPGEGKSLSDLVPGPLVLNYQVDDPMAAETALLQQGWRKVATSPQ